MSEITHKPIRKVVHMCMNVRGAMRNLTDNDLATLFHHDDGRLMTAPEARAALIIELAKGHKVIPLGPPCEGFDYTGGGCPGHVIEDEAAPLDGA